MDAVSEIMSCLYDNGILYKIFYSRVVYGAQI